MCLNEIAPPVMKTAMAALHVYASFYLGAENRIATWGGIISAGNHFYIRQRRMQFLCEHNRIQRLYTSSKTIANVKPILRFIYSTYRFVRAFLWGMLYLSLDGYKKIAMHIWVKINIIITILRRFSVDGKSNRDESTTTGGASSASLYINRAITMVTITLLSPSNVLNESIIG